MNTLEHGFGLVVPTRGFPPSQLGNVVYIDDDIVVRQIGSIFDDGHFQNLVTQSKMPLDHTTMEAQYPSTAAVFTMVLSV